MGPRSKSDIDRDFIDAQVVADQLRFRALYPAFPQIGAWTEARR